MAAPITSILIALLVVGIVNCNFTKPNCDELADGFYEFEQNCTDKYYECSEGVLHEHQCLNDTYFHQPSSNCISNRSEVLSCKCNDMSGAYWVGDANTCVLAFTRRLDYDDITWDEAFVKCKETGESWNWQMTGRLVHVTNNDIAIAVRDADKDDGLSWIGMRVQPGSPNDVKENFRWWLDPDKNRNAMYPVTKWSDKLEAVQEEHWNDEDCFRMDKSGWIQRRCDATYEYICEFFYDKCAVLNPCVAPSICVPDTYWRVVCACPINKTCTGTTTTKKPTTTTSTTPKPTTTSTTTTTTSTRTTTTATATAAGSTTPSTSVAPTTITTLTSTTTTDTVPTLTSTTTAKPTTATTTSTMPTISSMSTETTTTARSPAGTIAEAARITSTESTTSTNTHIPIMTSTTTTTRKPTTTTSTRTTTEIHTTTSSTTKPTTPKNCLPIDSSKFVKATYYNMPIVNNNYVPGTVAELSCHSISCGIQKSRCLNGIWLRKPGALCKPHMKVTEFSIPYKQKNKRAKGTYDLLEDLGKENTKNFGVCASRCTNTPGCTAYGWSDEKQHCELYQTFVKEMILEEAEGYKVAERSDVDDLE